MQRFSGTIHSRTPRSVPKLWTASIDIGEYTSGDKQHASKFTLWVPTPRQGTHVPGIFMRLSNPVGTSYSRMSSEEFADLYTFIRTTYSDATAAIKQAQDYAHIYSAAERALALEIDSQVEQHTLQPSIEDIINTPLED